jgi:hypothetical protein
VVAIMTSLFSLVLSKLLTLQNDRECKASLQG